MAKLKLKQNRRFFEFDYEFKDGEVEIFKYSQPTTSQMREALKIGNNDIEAQLDYTISVLKECLDGNRKDDLIKEQEDSNIFDFKETLDFELGKLNKRK